MNDDINIIDINEAEFNDKVIEEKNKLIIVDFWAPWCLMQTTYACFRKGGKKF